MDLWLGEFKDDTNLSGLPGGAYVGKNQRKIGLPRGAYVGKNQRKIGFSGNLVRLQGGTGKKTEECLGFSGNLVRLQGGTGKKTEECLGKYISVFWGFLY
ncbi:hypothetical protein NDU88_001437 [Pleurodeles waltl]|uniref:Uncharacterized protein n=1 Tax=Pleurodeles waltl TaxID=8319 RepID=A0AAV7KSN1_PLEWA|nr:hypothetical protein NDU88_001437 [Pleurodeles waltl]